MGTSALQHQPSSRSMREHTLLVATTDQDQRAFLATQLDADGHTVYEADNTAATIAKLSAHAIDVMLLGCLQRPADGPALLRAIRAGEHPRIHPAQPVITLGDDDELTVLRAYESGSDHHLPDTTGYVLLRASDRALEYVKEVVTNSGPGRLGWGAARSTIRGPRSASGYAGSCSLVLVCSASSCMVMMLSTRIEAIG